MPRIAVLITCHNRREKTLACLAALFANYLPPGYEMSVYLTDDGSTDDTESAVRQRFPSVEILRGDGTLYWNGGMREAFSRAMQLGFDYYLWLNDDTLLFRDALESMFRTLKDARVRKRGESIVVGCTKDPQSGELTYGGLISAGRIRRFRFSVAGPGLQARECETMNGNCVLISSEVARVIGNLEPRFVHALGDVDYGLRARRAGFDIVLDSDYVGTCARNSPRGSFADSSITRWRRFGAMLRPKGIPPAAWLVFTRRHGGILWPLYFVWPYLSVALGR